MKAQVEITLKAGVLDPQGKAVGNALRGLGYDTVGEVRQGKLIQLDLDETDPEAAREKVDQMCRSLLANPVVESYKIEIRADS